MNTILKLFRKIENARDTLVEYSNRSWWHSRIALLGICCLWVLSRAIYLPYLFYKLPQGRTTTRITAFALAFLMTMNAGSMGAYATGTSPSDIVEVISSAQAEPPTTPTTETPVAPPTETPVAPPTETPVTPPTETPVTPPTEIPATPPEGTLVTPPDGTLVTPPDGTTVTPPDGTTVTPPDGTTVTPPEEPPACTCNHAIGTSGVEGHGEDCPLYEAPSQPDCTCPPVDSGEVVHGEGCPMYAKPAAPEPSEAVKAVLALINTLPTMDELAAVDTEGEGFADYLAQLRLDTVAARSAFDALTDEEKAAFDAASLEKLTALEDVLAAMPMMMVEETHSCNEIAFDSVIDKSDTYGTGNYCLTGNLQDVALIFTGDVKLCLNGNKLSYSQERMAPIIIENDGTLSIYDCKGGGEIISPSYLAKIDNIGSGTFNLFGGTVTATDTSGNGIRNKVNGTINIHGGELKSETASTKMIENLGSGTVNLLGGTITASGEYASGVHNETDGIINVSGGTIAANGKSGYGIYNKAGKINVTNGKVAVTGDLSDGIYNATGEVNIAGGEVTAGGAGGVTIENSKAGTVNISDGIVSNTGTSNNSGGSSGVRNIAAGIVTITGGEITASGDSGMAVHNFGQGTVNISGDDTIIAFEGAPETFGEAVRNLASNGTINITGGTISAVGRQVYTVYNVRGGTMNISGGTFTSSTTNNDGLVFYNANYTTTGMTLASDVKITPEGAMKPYTKEITASIVTAELAGDKASYTLTGGFDPAPSNWMVYSENSGDTLAANVTATLSGSTLTLSGTGLTSGAYYVAPYNRAQGRGASDTRLKLTVTAPKITILVNGMTTASGATLAAAVKASNAEPSLMTALKITAGEVTTADWKYFAGGNPGDSTSPFTALTTFEVAAAVTSVANIPDGSSLYNIFPKSIQSVTIPQVITVGKSAFEKCTSLTTVVMPNVTTIESYAFSATALTKVNLPAAISINEAVFMECSSLSSVSLPAAKSIGSSAFQLCKALNTINLPATTDIRASAFWNCTTLNTVILPQASTIGNYAFLNCEKLATLKLGAAVPRVTDASAFSGCPKTTLTLVDADGNALTESTSPKLSVIAADYDAVADGMSGSTATDGKWYGWKVREPAAADKITIKINDTVTEYGGASLSAAVTAAGGASGITELTITKGVVTVEDWNYLKNLNKMTSFGINADIAKGKVVSIPDGSDAASIFPESIKNVTIMQEITVGGYAFDGCKLLDTVNLPAATVIGEYAFRNCEALTNVSLPKAIRIHQYAFGGCMALTEVLLPEAQYIRGNTFNGCKALATLKLPKATTIGASAFSGCTSLATLKLGATVPTSVNINAFEGCPAVRSLALVGTDGSPLTGTALTDAQAEYDKVVSPDTGTATDGLWFGWKVRDGSDVNVPVTGVTLNKTTLSLEAGKTAQLTEAIAPATATNKAVTWKTSNATVATVAGGLVTALKAGTATITVTTADGGKTATCAVSVKAKVISPAPGGKLEAPLTQEMVDSVFGEGNATLDGTTTPPTITIDNSITPKAPIVIDTDVTIVLGDKVITGEPGETPIFVGDNDKVTIVGPGTIAGGDSTVGSGGNGIDGGTGSDITIDGGAIVEGGNGTTGGDGITSSGNVTVDDGTVGGGNGSSGNGGDGVDTSTGTGSITIDNDGSATGGNGGNGSAGTGGNGGSGTNSGSGSTTVGGETTGGNGGSGTTAGGSGGGGSTSTGGGSVTVDGGGTTIGGAGGSGSSTGGNGGNGTSTSGTDTTINGGTTGGNGGNGTGNGSGGNGGDGAHQGSGEVDGSGTATGGNGGSGAGTGTGGTGGTGVGGGATAGSDLNVKDGISARVEVVGDAKTEVKLPDPAKTVDAVLTDAEKTDKDITDVKVTLKVDDKTAAKPNEDTIEAAKPMDSIVGAFFDITLKKAVTKTSGGTTTTDETNVTDTDSKMITITIEIPTNMRDGVEDSYVIIRVHGMDATKLATTQVGNKLTFDTDKFSTYAIAYTKSPTLPSDNTSGGSSSSNDGYDFWMEVKDEINSANSGDVIKVAAKANDKVPESTMAALRKSSGVTLVISWSGGKTITIPAGKAAKQELGRIYWPLSLLAELYAGIDLGTALTNPETGGPGKFIPVTGGELITLDAPTPAVNTIPGGTAGIQITPPDAGFEAEAFAGTEDAERANIRNAFAVMALMLTALAVGNGVRFCKRKIGKVEE